MIIVHRTTCCGHPDVWGKRDRHPVLGFAGNLPDNCGQGCHPTCAWNPTPETMARWDKADRPVVDLLPPGSRLPGHTAETSHDCAACHALYAQLTEKASTP